jgi:hypothetical protein
MKVIRVGAFAGGILLLLGCIPAPIRAADPVYLSNSGKLEYTSDALGNRVPDFSVVGYHSGEKDVPHVPVKLTLSPEDGDDTIRIQSAIDKIGEMPITESGHRGTLLLKRGSYQLSGALNVMHSGVVLRGEGDGPDGTILIAAGYDDLRYKRTFITVGNDDPVVLDESAAQSIADAYVPVGAKTVSVADASGYKAGQRVVIHRPSTPEWISSLGCDKIEAKWVEPREPRWVTDGDAPGFYFLRPRQFKENYYPQLPGESWEEFKVRLLPRWNGKLFNVTTQWDWKTFHMYYERMVEAVEGNAITFNAPIVHALDKQFGGGEIIPFTTRSRVSEVGVEHLRIVSEFGPPVPGYPYGPPDLVDHAQEHAWTAIVFSRNTENTWLRNVKGNYFGYALVQADGVRATIQDCVSLGHASVIMGSHRYPFKINGQLNLVQRCMTIAGRHEFVNGGRVWGPNVFVDCIGFDSKNIVGPHNHYAVGNLYDTIRTEYYMESTFRGTRGTGHGWLATSTVYYNCEANKFDVDAPPGGVSWVIGCGKIGEGKQVKPVSLYYQQLKERLGDEGVRRQTRSEYLKSLGQYKWVAARMRDESEELQRKCRL